MYRVDFDGILLWLFAKKILEANTKPKNAKEERFGIKIKIV